MPRFSVIVPVFRVQGHLRECLDSVLRQSYGDLEVIAVDDHSPDGCGAILDEYAARDRRLTALHLAENSGLGMARNAGIPHATGDYLIFLDSDDSLTPGALQAIADRLQEAADPDVLIYDYARTYWWGGTRRNVLAELLADPRVFSAAERPEILDLLMVVWNKAHRRDFVERHNFRFPPGYYEDTPWTFPVMFSAERVVTLDRICLNYRQRRQGNILSTTSRKHFDVHDQYRRVFAFLDEHPEHGAWRPYLRHKMGEHCLDILAKPDRLPPDSREEFFRHTAELFRQVRPPADRPGHSGQSGHSGHSDELPLPPELRALNRPYALHRARSLATAAAKELNRQAGRVRRPAVARVGDGWSALHAHRPLDRRLALYSSFGHQGVAGDPAAVYAAAHELAPHIRGLWVVTEDRVPYLPGDVEHVVLGSWRFRQLAARAGYFVGNTVWPATVPGRPGAVHIHTHQGTPLGFQGTDLLGKPGARLGVDVPQILRRADRWDWSLVANRHSERVWERAYPCHFTSARTGSPRNDVLVHGSPARRVATRARLGIPDGHTLVLYAPTRRYHIRGGHVDRLDLARFAADLGEGHTLMVRLHPALADGPARGMGLAELHRRGVLIDATDEPHVEDLMLASDVLVTDYSSLMFDYANLDRPIVVHADDWATYRASRGAYFDITAEPPGHVTSSYGELAELFASGTWRDEESAVLRSMFRARFCEFEDGRAAERVVRTLMLGEPMPGPAGATGRVPAPLFAGREQLASS